MTRKSVRLGGFVLVSAGIVIVMVGILLGSAGAVGQRTIDGWGLAGVLAVVIGTVIFVASAVGAGTDGDR